MLYAYNRAELKPYIPLILKMHSRVHKHTHSHELTRIHALTYIPDTQEQQQIKLTVTQLEIIKIQDLTYGKITVKKIKKIPKPRQFSGSTICPDSDQSKTCPNLPQN